MQTPRITSTRWFDAVNMPADQIDQRDKIRAMIVMGHGGNTVSRIPEMVKALEEIDLLVVADPHPTSFAAVSERRNGTYLLPIATSLECDGSRTASLAQASLVLVACMMAGSLSGQGVELYLRSAVLAFTLFGSFTLGQGIRAELSSAHDRASRLYALALVNHFVAYASIMTHRLLEFPGP